MSALSIQPTFPIFTETNGLPLENGYIWIGAANLDPQGNPINVYWDAALTIAAPQPIRTLNGYPSRNGTPARLYVNSDYSIRVQNSKGSLVYSAPTATERYSGVVVSVNAEDVIYDPPFSGAAQTNVEAKLAQTVSVKDFGAVGDGVADDTLALQSAMSSGASTVHVNAGTYKVTAQITVPANVSVIGEGRNASIITAQGNTTGTFTNTAVLYKAGAAPTQISDLSANLTQGQLTISFTSAHGLSVGDVFLIYNPTDSSFSDARPEYRAGEYCTVAAVDSATQVSVENGVYAAYLAADVDVYKCDAYCTGSIEGVTAVAPGVGSNGVVRAIVVEYGHKIELHDVGAKGSDNTSMSIAKCYKVNGSSLDCSQLTQSPGFSTQYGLAIGNSQQLDLSGSFVGFRHGITHGGGNDFSIPCRSSNVHDFFAKCFSSAIAAADWHGNCEWCVYENGQIFGGGLNIAGNNNRITGIKAHGENTLLVLGREILGCDHVVENIESYTGRDDTARGLIDIGGNSIPMDNTITRFGGQFIFRNITINAPNNTRFAINVRNRGFVGVFDVLVDNLTYTAPNSNSASFAAVSINTVSGSGCSRVQATNVTTLASTVTPAVTLGASDSGCLVKQNSQTGFVFLNTTTSVTSVESTVTFGKKFAKTPSVVVNPSTDSTGGDRCAAIARAPDATEFIARFTRVDDTANFANALFVGVNWTASVNEW